MLTSRSEIMLQVVLGAFLLGFMYVGVEKLWISKTNAQLRVQQLTLMVNRCSAMVEELKKPKETEVK